MIFNEIFAPPYAEKIQRILPTLFNMVELENRRGEKLGMEVGTARERVLIALFMYVYENKSVEFPSSTSPEEDVLVNGEPVSIKTKMGKGFSGVKLIWTVDWNKVAEFQREFTPSSHLLFVNILWDETGVFCFIPLSAQKEILSHLGRENYMKLPRQGTNPRGVEIASEALNLLIEHEDSQSLPIEWKRDTSLLREHGLYERWIRLWDTL